MKQKIEWYREVLEIEPASRVFFPLAKLLAADNQPNEAILVLKQGMAAHPEHLESRLLLIELLYKQHKSAAVQSEIDQLSQLLQRYPQFWLAWSEELSKTPEKADAAIALRFFAEALQGNAVSWTAILARGLQFFVDSPNSPEQMTASLPSPAASQPLIHESTPVNPSVTQSVPVTAADTVSKPEQASLLEDAPVVAMPVVALPVTDTVLAEDDDDEMEDDAETAAYAERLSAKYGRVEQTSEPLSFRTRSMAEVLAEQGDIAGAIDIYNELISSAAESDLPPLQARIEELSVLLSQQPADAESNMAEGKQQSGGENARLVNLLESLAQRLEARSR